MRPPTTDLLDDREPEAGAALDRRVGIIDVLDLLVDPYPTSSMRPRGSMVGDRQEEDGLEPGRRTALRFVVAGPQFSIACSVMFKVNSPDSIVATSKVFISQQVFSVAADAVRGFVTETYVLLRTRWREDTNLRSSWIG
jgi:hypothetical protein